MQSTYVSDGDELFENSGSLPGVIMNEYRISNPVSNLMWDVSTCMYTKV
jgi:hypothetical protein